ncbi:MAG: host attachment protein [Azospirillum sp.]|nr:host attachment protein [Azospirillum sp.]
MVADARKAFALSDAERLGAFELVPAFRFEAPPRRDSDIGTSKPILVHGLRGKTASSATWEPRKLQMLEQRRFLSHVVAEADACHRDGKFRHLALVAPARALGDLRVAISNSLADSIVLEHVGDLTKTPPAEIGRRYGEWIRNGEALPKRR